MASKTTPKTRKYEAMFLLGSNFTADVDGAVKLVRSTIEKHGGNVLVAKKWDERKLAYEIGKQKRGLYVISYFEAPGSTIAPLERDVKLSEDFTRVLVTDAGHLELSEMETVEPQPIAPPQPERNPWDMPPEASFGADSPAPRKRKSDDEGSDKE